MKIQFRNEELYFKYNSLKTLCKVYNIEINSIEKVEQDNDAVDLIQIDFTTDKAYTLALNKHCIIPIEHDIITA